MVSICHRRCSRNISGKGDPSDSYLFQMLTLRKNRTLNELLVNTTVSERTRQDIYESLDQGTMFEYRIFKSYIYLAGRERQAAVAA